MSFLGKAILAFWADVDASGEADYVDWHNREHMPERCAVPGFGATSRWRRPPSTS